MLTVPCMRLMHAWKISYSTATLGRIFEGGPHFVFSSCKLTYHSNIHDSSATLPTLMTLHLVLTTKSVTLWTVWLYLPLQTEIQQYTGRWHPTRETKSITIYNNESICKLGKRIVPGIAPRNVNVNMNMTKKEWKPKMRRKFWQCRKPK
jgi:hypothetical protein